MQNSGERYLSLEEMLKFAKKIKSWKEVEDSNENYIGEFQNYKIMVDGRSDSPMISITFWNEVVGSSHGNTNTQEGEQLSKLYETIRKNQYDLENRKQTNITKIARDFINSLE